MKGLNKIVFLLPRILTDSIKIAFAILGGIEIVLSFTSLSLDSIGSLPAQISVVILAYVVIVIVVVLINHFRTKNEVSLNIRGMKIVVKEGDIFSAKGWKVIPFNERFDTLVDENVISSATLNGKYINSLDDTEKTALQKAIVDDEKSPVAKAVSPDGKTKYGLGTIKTFQETMMLALTHFNEQNEAHTNRAEYENTLRTMWREIQRTYQGKPINLPLIGSGITRLDDMTEKPNEQLLKCILCTLQTSAITFDENAGITIFLTRKALETINLYALKRIV